MKSYTTVSERAYDLLEKHGRYHPELGGFYSARIGSKRFRAKDTADLREKIEVWLREHSR